MTTLTNSAEGGTNGVTVTTANSGGASGNAWDQVGIGTNCIDAYDNTEAAHGTLSYAFQTQGTAGTSANSWAASLGTGQSQVWFREYLFFTANPAVNFRIWNTLNTVGGSLCAAVTLNTTGHLIFQNSAGTAIFTTTATIPLNSWFRIEGFVIGSATVGQVELKLFATPDSITPTEVDTSAATQNTFGTMNQWRYGILSSLTNVAKFWLDDLGVSNTGYLGPAFTLAPAQPPVTVWRRGSSRVVSGFTPVRTTNAAVTPVNGTVQPRATVPAPRRPQLRAFVQFTPVTTINGTVPPPVQQGTPPAIPTSGGTINLTTRVFREIRPGDVPDSGAALPKVTGRAFMVPIPNDVEHTIHAWPEDIPPVPPVPGMLDALGQAAASAYAASSRAVELGRIFADPPYERQPKKCGAIRKVGGVMLTCGRKPGHGGKHTDRGLDWR